MILLWIQICPFYKSMIIAIWLRYLPWNYPGSSFCKHNREPSQSPVDSQQPTYNESDKAFSVNRLGAGSDLQLPGGSLEIQLAQWNLKGPRPEQCILIALLYNIDSPIIFEIFHALDQVVESIFLLVPTWFDWKSLYSWRKTNIMYQLKKIQKMVSN